MKFASTIAGTLLLLATIPAGAAAQDGPLRIAYVDSDQIIKQAPGYEEASQEFNRTAESWQDSLEQKRSRLQELFEEYRRQEAVLSDAERTEKQQEILQLEQETQSYFQEKFGPQGAAEAKQAELMRPIIERVNQAIENVRSEQGYSLIFDLQAPGLVAGDPALNITDAVVRRMTAQAGASPSR